MRQSLDSIRKILICFLMVGLLLPNLYIPAMAEEFSETRTNSKTTIAENRAKSTPDEHPIAQQSIKPMAAIPGTQSKITGITRQALRLSPQPHHALMRSLLLLMAYEQDPELIKMIRKQGYANPAILGVVLGVYGITLAEGIYLSHGGYTNPTAADYHTIKNREIIPGNLTMIIGGLGLASTVGVAAWIAHFNRKISKRKQAIRNQVDQIFDQLSNGVSDSDVQAPLFALLKDEESVSEFLGLWHAAHSKQPTETMPAQPESQPATPEIQ